MLSNKEKDDLYTVITAVLGEDYTIKQYVSQFNERTVAVIEDAINASVKCNSNMKSLVIEVIGAAAIAAGG